ncbi:MAG: hypothetical protein WA817_11745 [Candidatus Acidiferrum sp.]
MLKTLSDSLSKLRSNSVQVLEFEAYTNDDMAGMRLTFANGTTLQANYWRVVKDGKELISSFDHRQIYGLPAPIDAIAELQRELQDRAVVKARLDKETGDLFFEFTENVKLQIFGFSAYEVWQVHFPDGTGEYSNSAK